mmetsp:Transcript_25326/g.60598  ORF Transcript_25326/g.60598 Transcript_25326/m.60598 type:complete len:232 (-) Transcript_25326:53-748(-)
MMGGASVSGGTPITPTSASPLASSSARPMTKPCPVMKPLVPSIGSSTQQRSPSPRAGSSPRSTSARKVSRELRPLSRWPSSMRLRGRSRLSSTAASRAPWLYSEHSRCASAHRLGSARRSAASSSPMKRSLGNSMRSSPEIMPWMAKSAAVTGVSSPALMSETPAVVSHASIVLPLVASPSATSMSQASALHSCIARCTAATAVSTSAERSPAHSEDINMRPARAAGFAAM